MPKLIKPGPDDHKRWAIQGLRVLQLAWPSWLVLVIALYGGASMLYRILQPLGLPAMLAAEAVIILVSGPNMALVATALAQRVSSGARGLNLPTQIAPLTVLQGNVPYFLMLPALWISLMVVLHQAGVTVIEEIAYRPLLALGLSAFTASLLPPQDSYRMARAQYFGADGGPKPDVDTFDLLILLESRARLLGIYTALPILAYTAAVLAWQPLAILCAPVLFWIAATCYITVVNLYGGTPRVQRAEAPYTLDTVPEGS
ncbi:hypothetical protein CKO28_00460 [Rhodovibrio sodomensis]|uniref:Uncharacterized protein n=1 Tax=Rhodovibrio sodomensis TaxID=1088 RepID=A0ABS1D8R2_9PROT|nr:hypothetical protein [Rhodovibrio sodomensis]MBK1666512.1 hypothetical protein [Rhodovibrio sodomensis]